MQDRPAIANPLFLFVFFVAAIASQTVRAADTPRAVVTQFHEQLLGIMKDGKTVGPRERYAKLAPDIERLFDLKRMTRIAASDSWPGATDGQQKRLIKAFKHMGVSRLVTLFDGYSGEVFETLEEREGPQNSRMVRTRLLIPGDRPVGITYVTVRMDGGWAIVDALLDDSISELTVRRSEYRSILKSRGVEGLIEVLNNKAEELLAK